MPLMSSIPGMYGHGALLDTIAFEQDRDAKKQEIAKTLEEVLAARQNREFDAQKQPFVLEDLGLKNDTSRETLRHNREMNPLLVEGQGLLNTNRELVNTGQDLENTFNKNMNPMKLTEQRLGNDLKALEVIKGKADTSDHLLLRPERIAKTRAETLQAKGNARTAVAGAVAAEFKNKVNAALGIDHFKGSAITAEQKAKVDLLNARIAMLPALAPIIDNLPDSPASAAMAAQVLEMAGLNPQVLAGMSVKEMAKTMRQIAKDIGEIKYDTSGEAQRAVERREDSRTAYQRELEKAGIEHMFAMQLAEHKANLDRMAEEHKAANKDGKATLSKNWEQEVLRVRALVQASPPGSKERAYAEKLYKETITEATRFGLAKDGFSVQTDEKGNPSIRLGAPGLAEPSNDVITASNGRKYSTSQIYDKLKADNPGASEEQIRQAVKEYIARITNGN